MYCYCKCEGSWGPRIFLNSLGREFSSNWVQSSKGGSALDLKLT